MKKISGTKEWAEKNYNVIDGCKHDCVYCYAKNMALRFDRTTVDTWKNEKERLKKPGLGRGYRVMYPTTHDISEENLSLSMEAVAKILGRDNEILIVSKPHLKCIQAICEKFASHKDQILFRFTIGSIFDTVLGFWEPNAPTFGERLASLKFAFKEGFRTSVSCEPMLDASINFVVEDVHPFVNDAIWIGKMNKAVTRVAKNTGNDPKYVEAAKAIEAQQNDAFIKKIYEMFKDDPKVKWKESIKEVVGLKLAEQAGEDV